MCAFRSLLSDNAPAVNFADILEVLSLPASLVAGMSELILHASDDPPLSGVAEAQEEWSRHWQWAQRKSKHVHIAEPIRKRCLTLLGEYTTARDLLMLHNLRLVYSIAGRYRGKGLAFPDLVQEGMLGLIRASEKFRHQRGYRFSTYCFNWISQAIRRVVAENSGIIRYPAHVNEQLGKLYGQRAADLAHSGAEIADKMAVSREWVRQLERSALDKLGQNAAVRSAYKNHEEVSSQ